MNINEQYRTYRLMGYGSRQSLNAAKFRLRLDKLEIACGLKPVLCMQSEDINPQDDLDEIDAKYVLDQLRRGNEAAWFCADVHFEDGNGRQVGESEFLGCCSYRSAEEFTTQYFPCYFSDMVQTCLENLESDFHVLGLPQSDIFGILECLGRLES